MADPSVPADALTRTQFGAMNDEYRWRRKFQQQELTALENLPAASMHGLPNHAWSGKPISARLGTTPPSMGQVS
jgi:hypothetical protein